jgi:hypothetical protein
MALHRTTFVGEMKFESNMTAQEALDFVHVCLRIPVACYVDRFTSSKVEIFTPSQCTRTTFTGPLFELYALVVAMRHSKKPAPKGASTRAMGVQALDDYLARPASAHAQH